MHTTESSLILLVSTLTRRVGSSNGTHSTKVFRTIIESHTDHHRTTTRLSTADDKKGRQMKLIPQSLKTIIESRTDHAKTVHCEDQDLGPSVVSQTHCPVRVVTQNTNSRRVVDQGPPSQSDAALDVNSTVHTSSKVVQGPPSESDTALDVNSTVHTSSRCKDPPLNQMLLSMSIPPSTRVADARTPL